MPSKLKAFVPTLESVEENLREFYIADTDHEGKARFKLDAEGLEDVGGLKKTNADLKAKLEKARARAKPLEGIEGEIDEADLEEIITAGRAERERLKTGKGRDDVENAKKQVAAANAKEIKKLADNAAALEAALIEEVAGNRGKLAVKSAKGNDTLLDPHMRAQIKVVRTEEDGVVKYDARVIDPKTKTERAGKDGAPMTVEALVAEMKEKPEYADAFEGSGASGSGAPAEGGSGTPTPTGSAARNAPALKDAKRVSQDYSL